ncbi:dihydrolipoyl dehydrogenase family protein [Microvirga puerhi]|uniref:FAD-dependent oxidoreductase n=1 Tax=Microvirga puerhi TaxID=2876078 RepID=A0ABS7VLY9_9HYPH|nr:FAD-dependent oxidoreductase [Microvirga puerhi]
MTASNEAARKQGVLKPDLCVIGCSRAGLLIASAAAALGVSVVLVDNEHAGETSVETDRIAHQAFIAAARQADAGRRARGFGIGSGDEPAVDFVAVAGHVREVVKSLAPMTSHERYRAMGIHVIEARGRFIDRRTLAAGEVLVRPRRFVIAVGSKPAIPDIPEIDGVSCLTAATIGSLQAKPEHLAILGGNAFGLEMAQAYRRFGAQVSVLESESRILPHEDPEMTAVVERALRAEGVSVRTGVAVSRIEGKPNGAFALVLQTESGEEVLAASHLLVATGRKMDLEGLGLGNAAVEAGPSGIWVDRGLRTTNRRIYAVGDCIGGSEFSIHAASHHAELVLRRVLFRLPARLGAAPVPRATFTDPELASVGFAEEEARVRHREIRILRWAFVDNDRALAERCSTGHLKAVVTPNGQILGCTIAGPRAGELIMPWVLAMARNLKVSDLAGLVYPYPTLSEITKSAAVEFLKPSAQNPWVRRFVGFVSRLG